MRLPNCAVLPKKGECPYSVSNAIRTLVMVDDNGLAFLRKSHGGCGVPPARRQEPPFESVIQKKAVTPKGMTAFLVDDNGLEPLTLRTSSECSTS